MDFGILSSALTPLKNGLKLGNLDIILIISLAFI